MWKLANQPEVPWPFEVILVSILLEQEKEMVELREKIDGREKREGEAES
jgi:hypothetical protein